MTISTERLRRIVSGSDFVADVGGKQSETVTEIARELLAVREAQPVASTTKSNIDAVLGGVSTVIWPVRCFKGGVSVDLYTAPPALPANVIGRSATPDDSPYPATISGGCLLAQAWADGYNVRNAVTAAPASAVPAEMTADQMYNLLLEKGGVMSPVDAAVFAWNACRTSAMKNTPQAASQLAPSVDNGNMQNTPAGFKLVPAESNDAWAERYCELTNKHPDGGLTTYIGDGAVTITFREKSKREIDAMLAAAPTPTHK